MINFISKYAEIIARGKGVNDYNVYLNKKMYPKYAKEFPNENKLIKRNKAFKNYYKDKRCFILGNGPSLKNVDFSLLRDEYVFACNRITLVAGWEKARPNFWVCVDGGMLGYWKPACSRESCDEIIKKLNEVKNLKCFVPIEAYPTIRKRNYDKYLSLYYLPPELLQPTDNITFDIDFTKYGIQSYSVTHRMIMLAIYMGFKEIYLLGCDATTIQFRLDEMLGKQGTDHHAYSDSDEEKKIVNQRRYFYGFEEALRAEYGIFQNYRMLYRYCKNHNIKLINLSETTFLDCIPRDTLRDILN